MAGKGSRGSPELDIRSYNTVINAFATAGAYTIAAEWLVEAVEEGLQPRIRSYSAVIAACAQVARTL